MGLILVVERSLGESAAGSEKSRPSEGSVRSMNATIDDDEEASMMESLQESPRTPRASPVETPQESDTEKDPDAELDNIGEWWHS